GHRARLRGPRRQRPQPPHHARRDADAALGSRGARRLPLLLHRLLLRAPPGDAGLRARLAARTGRSAALGDGAHGSRPPGAGRTAGRTAGRAAGRAAGRTAGRTAARSARCTAARTAGRNRPGGVGRRRARLARPRPQALAAPGCRAARGGRAAAGHSAVAGAPDMRTMTAQSRIQVAVATALLLLTFLFPIWRVDLFAPQYPDGLGLRIGLTKIEGAEPYDLQNIDILNHYVGMRPIDAEAFPELQYMPWIVAALALVGALTAALGRRWLLFTWTGLLILAAIAGFADYYRWLHAYGHDLDPTAAIKLPGGGFQPPLLGSKTILNITVRSLPALGGWAAILAGILAVVATVTEIRRQRTRSHAPGGADDEP